MAAPSPDHTYGSNHQMEDGAEEEKVLVSVGTQTDIGEDFFIKFDDMAQV